MNPHKKVDFPVAKIRRFLEPGPIVLVSSAWRGETNISGRAASSNLPGCGLLSRYYERRVRLSRLLHRRCRNRCDRDDRRALVVDLAL